MIFVYEFGIFDGFLCKVLDVCFGVDNIDVRWVVMMVLVGKCNVLFD